MENEQKQIFNKPQKGVSSTSKSPQSEKFQENYQRNYIQQQNIIKGSSSSSSTPQQVKESLKYKKNQKTDLKAKLMLEKLINQQESDYNIDDEDKENQQYNNNDIEIKKPIEPQTENKFQRKLSFNSASHPQTEKKLFIQKLHIQSFDNEHQPEEPQSKNQNSDKKSVQRSKRTRNNSINNNTNIQSISGNLGLNLIIGTSFNKTSNSKSNIIQSFNSEEKLNKNLSENQVYTTPIVANKQKKILLGAINSLTMLDDNKIYNLLDKNVVLTTNSKGEIVPFSQLSDKNNLKQRKITCNCKRTKCLKLYCDCFQNGNFCNEDCNCQNCQNKIENKNQRDAARQQVMDRNQGAFQQKIVCVENEREEEVYIHNKGCNCKKSGCKKKYCECYNQGVKCQASCKCEDCQNVLKISDDTIPDLHQGGNHSSQKLLSSTHTNKYKTSHHSHHKQNNLQQTQHQINSTLINQYQNVQINEQQQDKKLTQYLFTSKQSKSNSNSKTFKQKERIEYQMDNDEVYDDEEEEEDEIEEEELDDENNEMFQIIQEPNAYKHKGLIINQQQPQQFNRFQQNFPKNFIHNQKYSQKKDE